MTAENRKKGIDDESLLRLAAVAIREQMEKEENVSGEEIVLSEREIQERWNAVMGEYCRKKFRVRSGGLFKRAAAIAAMLFIAISGTFITTMAVSPTIREIVLTDFGEYSTLGALLSDDRAEVPEEWEEKYFPTYIPAEYHYDEIRARTKIKNLIYVNSEGLHVFFSIIPPDADVDFDTENMRTTEMKIKGHGTILLEKLDGSYCSILINYDDYIIHIFGPIPGEEAVKIAESISE